jgi:drug/metabolite transporter (DMT)-like permease
MFIMFVGVVAISPDAMFVRLMQAEAAGGGAGADADLQITFWKYLLMSPIHLAVTIWHAGGVGQLLQSATTGSHYVIGGGVCQLCISVSLNVAYVNTVAARAHLFFALSPFWAALFSQLFLKEAVPTRTVVALLFALAAVSIVFLPALIPSIDHADRDHHTAEQASLAGDLLAVLAGAALGALIVVSAAARQKCPEAPMLASVLVGSAAVVLLSLVWQAASGRPSMGTVSMPFVALALADGACICVVYAATVIAPRYASSAEVSVLCPYR